MADFLTEAMNSTGAGPVFSFCKTTHHDVTDVTDPSKVKLGRQYVVAIVGASRGIGAGIAHSYAHAGATGLVLASRRTSGLEQVAAECKKINPDIKISIVPCDITKAADIENCANETKKAFDRLDVLVVNSGVGGGTFGQKVHELSVEDITSCTDVNFTGTFLSCKHFIPQLLATQDGSKAIVAINSYNGVMSRGPFVIPSYCTTKAAQTRLMEIIHEQYHDTDGLVTYTLHPGAVKTELSMAGVPADLAEKVLNDSTELAGGFSVWLTKDKQQEWLSGRFLSVNWDVEELMRKKQDIVDKRLLRFTVDV